MDSFRPSMQTMEFIDIETKLCETRADIKTWLITELHKIFKEEFGNKLTK